MTAISAAGRRPAIDPLQQLLIFILGLGGTGGILTVLVKGKLDKDQRSLDSQASLALKQVELQRQAEQARDDRLQKEVDRYYTTVVERVGRLETKVDVLEKDLRDALSREAALQVQLAQEIALRQAETKRADDAVMARAEMDARITHLEADLAHQKSLVRILAVQYARDRGGVEPEVILEELAGEVRRTVQTGDGDG